MMSSKAMELKILASECAEVKKGHPEKVRHRAGRMVLMASLDPTISVSAPF